jgi:hypothetical protein
VADPFLSSLCPKIGPPDEQRENRYNQPGQRALYLAKTVATVVDETAGRDGEDIFVQEFALDLGAARALLLEQDMRKSFPHLYCLLLFAEKLPLDAEQIAPASSSFRYPYRVGQFIRSVCDSQGVLAVQYPSVRGGYKQSSDALNVALFGSVIEDALGMMRGDPFPASTDS